MTDAAQFLADSPDRLALLERLRETPGSPRDLADELDQSRRSVQRNLAAFADRGWAEKRDGDYRLTTTGLLVTRRHREYVDALAAIGDNDDLYAHLPADVAPEPDLLANATLVVAETDQPQAPVSHYVSTVESAETSRVRMISPVLSRLFHDAHAELVVSGVETELVLDGATIDRAREKNPAEFATVVGVPPFTLYHSPDPISFGLTLTDDRVLLLAYDDSGQLHACADGTDPEFYAWATDCFERRRERSESVSGLDALRS
ncbi:helix-turn-helix transcriptional regulator [Haloarcula nitratireducens]|uniref:ArsR family transcriptional regulator n=1 Tax=Haloarcula nitratireducens TaxID=2487749 RepID=A0AAW4P9R2_9EURY|nr:ArsR family transcriptional regulator [Halomicroarcula nitratireducens]MBX0294476.1 ArsR family transcriptional regulator [Halomicroarcula nitratireducens]